MTRQKAINQLKYLREHCKEMNKFFNPSIWGKDTEALDFAIDSLKAGARPFKHRICTNESKLHEVDQFICSNCGIKLEGWTKIEYDEETGDKEYYETSLRFCPNCGAKIIEQ